MKNGKLIIAGAVVGSLALGAGGWFLGVQPFLAAAAASEQELAGVQQINDLQATRLAQLQAAGQRTDSLDAQLADLRTEIPTDPAMADLLGQLSTIEASTGARVVGVTSGASSLIGPAVDGGTGAAASGADGSAASSGSTASAAAAAAAAAAQSVPIPGMEALPVTLSAKGSQEAVRAFLSGLQGKGRLITMVSIAFSTDEEDSSSRVDVTGLVYVLPAS